MRDYSIAILRALALCLSLAAAPAREVSSRPVQVAPRPAGPLFATIPNLTAGIHFTNRLPIHTILENNNYMNGSGVAAGDFDGDGLCDLYFCAIAGTNALYRNLGDWKFQDVSASAGVGLPGRRSTGALFADVDADGDLDLLVATLGGGVHLFLNDGTGKFRDATAASGLAARTGSTSLALADVDGDGDLDLYVCNYGEIPIMRSGGRAEVRQVNGQWVVTGPFARRLKIIDGRMEEFGEPDVLYLNDGTGQFRAVPWNSPAFLDESGRPMPEPFDFGLAVQMRDINGDGAPDIYVCNDFQTPDRVWLNDGRGVFRALPAHALRKQSYSSMGVDFGDLDRDGHLDFFVVEMLSREHSRRMRQVVSMRVNIPTPGEIENRPQVVRNTLFRGRGDGTFAELGNYSRLAAADWAWQPVFLDADLDGFEDILVVNGMPFDILDRDTLALIGSFRGQTPTQSRTNLLLYPSLPATNVAFRNLGNFKFEDRSHKWGFVSPRISQGIALADLDNDGDLDLAINCLNDAPLLYRNDSSASRIAVRLRGRERNSRGIGARISLRGGPAPPQTQEMLAGGRYLSGDDTMRVFAAGPANNIEVHWRSGRKTVVTNARPNQIYELQEPEGQSTDTDAPTPATTPLFKDVSSLLGGHNHREEFFPDYARQPLLMKQLSQLGPGVAWIDLTNDGTDWLVLGAGRGSTLGVFRGDKSGGFQPVAHANRFIAPDDTAGLAAWTWSDGRRGLLAAISNYETTGTNRPAVLELRGDLSIRGLAVPNDHASVGPLAVADIDGDGDLDLFVGGRVIPGAYPSPASSRIYLQQNNALAFDTAHSELLEKVGLVSGAIWTDLTGDGFPELVLACEWGPIRIFRNDRGQLAPWDPKVAGTSRKLSQFTGLWHSVAAGDFDGDGRLDLVAGNWGLNDAHTASPEHPLRLHHGDLSGTGAHDLLESYYAPELRAEVPLRSFAVLSQAFGALTRFYTSHRAFSTATIADLLPKLGKASMAEANILASIVLLNRGQAFALVELPFEAQLAPAFALNVADANGDGHEDIFMSQNFFAVRPEWPRLDAGRGLWLLGDGTGKFLPMPGQESGIAIYGEQRGAALADFNGDGRIDLAVSQNGAATRLFQNQGARPGFRIRLKGPPANPDAIGATIRLEFNSQLGPAREVRSGSGYWSQDSVTQVLSAESATAVEVKWPGGKNSRVPLSAKDGTVLVTPP